MAKHTTQKEQLLNGHMTVNSFFAGIGGFDLAFEKSGFKTGFYCEINEFCRSVLKRHWPNVPNTADIQAVNASQIPHADVWTAGFPCQDLSLARTPHGRSGLKGTQSGLFFTFLALLEAHKPSVVLLENVAGLLNSHKGADFKTLISSLTELGYAVAWRVLNARYFGAPQSRPRIFICAVHGSPELAVRALYEESVAPLPKNERQGFVIESKCGTSGALVPQVSFCISATSGRHTGLDWARSYVTYPNAVRRLTPLECERLQGLPDNWTLPDKDYVIPIRGIESNRYHAIGNAVCVPVADWIANRVAGFLMAESETKPPSRRSETKPPSRRSTEKRLDDLATRSLSANAKAALLSKLEDEVKWKTGGCAFKEWLVTTSVSSSAIAPISSKFINVIEKSKVHDRYYLSPNAIQGILRRVDKLGRSLFPPLDAALRRIVSAPMVANESALSATNLGDEDEFVAAVEG